MTLDDVIQIIRDSWPQRLERGRVTHVHRNHLRLPDGSLVHLRVLVQLVESPTPNISEDLR